MTLTLDRPAPTNPSSPADIAVEVESFLALTDQSQLSDTLTSTMAFARSLPADVTVGAVNDEVGRLAMAEEALPPPAAIAALLWVCAQGAVEKEAVLAHLNSHPAVHQAGRVAVECASAVAVVDLSEKRPSLPTERFELVRQVTALPPAEREPLRKASEQQRAAGRFESWPALMKSWDAATTRGDQQAALVAAYTFSVYDQVRKTLPSPSTPTAPAAPSPMAAARGPSLPRSDSLTLGKIQGAFLKRLSSAPRDVLRDAVNAAPQPKSWPVTQQQALRAWETFTTDATARYRANGDQEILEDTRKHLGFAAVFTVAERPLRNDDELKQRLAELLKTAPAKGPTTEPPKKTPAPLAAPVRPAPAGLKPSPLERALKYFDTIGATERAAIIEKAATAYAAGPDSVHANFDAARENLKAKRVEVAEVVVAAVATKVVTPGIRRGPTPSRKAVEEEHAFVGTLPNAKQAKEIQKFVAAAMKTDAPRTAILRDYALASLQSIEDKKMTERAWVLAHAVSEVERKLPTDWKRIEADLLED
jgi:hypothetical protein